MDGHYAHFLVVAYELCMMYRQNQALLDLCQPELAALGYELLGIEHHQDGNRAILRVYIDKDTGVTIDDCAVVSHQLTGLLDVADPVKGTYTLEVSSPGLDRPIFTELQFKRFIGEMVKVRLHQKHNGRRRYIGLLVAVEVAFIVICCDDENIEIPFSLIETARLVPNF